MLCIDLGQKNADNCARHASADLRVLSREHCDYSRWLWTKSALSGAVYAADKTNLRSTRYSATAAETMELAAVAL